MHGVGVIRGERPAFLQRHSRPQRGPMWYRVGSDSVRFIWSDGFVRVVMELAVTPDSLIGTAYRRDDNVYVDASTGRVIDTGWPRARAVARPVPCSEADR